MIRKQKQGKNVLEKRGKLWKLQKINNKEWADIQEAVDTTNIFYDFKYKAHLAQILHKHIEELKNNA